MIFERIFRAFAQHKLRYAVIGGIAVNLHGYSRLTGDLDIVLSLTDENLGCFIEVTRQLNLVPRLPVRIDDFAVGAIRDSWVQEKNMKVFSVYNPSDPLEHIDVKMDAAEAIERYIRHAEVMVAGDIEITVVNIDDLIKLKLQASRERDLVDVRALQRIKELNEQ